MNTLTSWMPSIETFAVPFLLASLLSGLTYWLAHLSSPVMRWVRIVFSTIAGGLLLFSLVATSATDPFPALVALAVVVAASALQALLERAIDGDHFSWKQQFTRTFFTYLCSFLLVYFVFAVFVAKLAASPVSSSLWSLDFYTMLYGFSAGFIIAPLSISFFRWMLPTLHLRPGLDRPLREEETAR